jgi:phage gp37-like protein
MAESLRSELVFTPIIYVMYVGEKDKGRVREEKVIGVKVLGREREN